MIAMLIGSTLLAAAPAIPAQGTDSATPPHRRHHAIAYDPATRRVLIYGGQHLVSETEAPVLGDIWSWDGRQWTQVASAAGAGAMAHKLFADGAGGVFASGGPQGLTTSWNGERWVVLDQDSTSHREMAAGAYDSDRRRFVLVGGHIGGRAFPADTWEFDGRRWNRVATDGPPPMLGSAMAYDARRRVLVLFGGLEPTGRKRNDTWEWDGTRWSRAAGDGPAPRFGAGMAYDARRGESVLFGGLDSTNGKLNDTWLWNGHRWRQAEPGDAPPARSEGYLAYDESRDVTVMFGGEGAQTVPSLGDTWEWNGTRWKRVH